MTRTVSIAIAAATAGGVAAAFLIPRHGVIVGAAVAAGIALVIAVLGLAMTRRRPGS